jgi:hypothetical protein
VSKLRRDRRALRTARYVHRCEALTGWEYTGTGRWGMASYRALNWLHKRKVHAVDDDVRADRQAHLVNRMFYNW